MRYRSIIFVCDLSVPVESLALIPSWLSMALHCRFWFASSFLQTAPNNSPRTGDVLVSGVLASMIWLFIFLNFTLRCEEQEAKPKMTHATSFYSCNNHLVHPMQRSGGSGPASACLLLPTHAYCYNSTGSEGSAFPCPDQTISIHCIRMLCQGLHTPQFSHTCPHKAAEAHGFSSRFRSIIAFFYLVLQNLQCRYECG